MRSSRTHDSPAGNSMVRKKNACFCLIRRGRMLVAEKNEQNGFYFTIIAQNYAI